MTSFRIRRISLSALLALAAIAIAVPSLALAGDAAPPAAQASKGKKKKCPKGKVRRKGKCVKRKGAAAGGKQPGAAGGGQPGTTAPGASPPGGTPPAGPAVRDGSYTCFDAAGTLYIHGNTYDVNSGAHHPYTYDPATKIVTFVDGDYKSFYGVWEGGDDTSIEIRANYTDEYTKPGDYLWTCSD